jgi:transcriptional regulator with XRE-family HTH domain
VSKTIERLKGLSEDARCAYADSVSNTFLTAQIKTLQAERGLTQEKLAELVGTQQSGISRWLNTGFATCKIESLRKFAKAYGVRLHISFEEFGTLPSDVRGFTRERLAPRKFEEDPAFKEPPGEQMLSESGAATNGGRPAFENKMPQQQEGMLDEHQLGAQGKTSENGNLGTERKGMTRALEPTGNYPIEDLAA